MFSNTSTDFCTPSMGVHRQNVRNTLFKQVLRLLKHAKIFYYFVHAFSAFMSKICTVRVLFMCASKRSIQLLMMREAFFTMA